MRQRIVFIFMLMVVACCGVRGALGVTVVIAHGDAPRAEQWETLDVGVPASGGTVGVRDVRGGLMVVRKVQGSAGDTMHVWMPLPFLRGSDLAKDEWPVEVTWTPAGGTQQSQKVVVRRPGGTAGGAFRVAVVEGGVAGALEQRVPWSAVTPLPVVYTRVKAEEVVSAPPLVFAGFDAVLLSKELGREMEEGRALDLLSAGVRLVLVRDGPAPGLAGLPWAAVNGSGAWIVPREPLARPGVVEAGVGTAALAMTVTPKPALRMTMMLVAPVAVGVVLMARGLFRHRTWVYGGSGAGLAVVTVVAVLLCEQMGGPVTRRLEWSQVAAGHASPNMAVVMLTETAKSAAPLLSQGITLEVADRAVLWPVARDAGEYFSWRDARLFLEGATGGGSRGGFFVEAPARGMVTLLGRGASLAHADGAEGWTIEGGYLTHAPGKAGAAAVEGQLLTEWAADHPAMRGSLLAWYHLRCEPRRRYLLHAVGAGSSEVVIDDLGLPLDYRNVP